MSNPITTMYNLVRSGTPVETALAKAHNSVGTGVGDFIELEDVSGSAGLPAVDGSQLIIPWKIVQVASNTVNSLVSGSTAMPHGDAIPQNTEGTELITVSITPGATTNKLIIEFNLQVSVSTGETLSYALFQDSTASALAAGAQIFDAVNHPNHIVMRYEMAAGTTSSTTFKVRAGVNATGTVYMNGESSARRFGGVSQSIISVTEVAA